MRKIDWIALIIIIITFIIVIPPSIKKMLEEEKEFKAFASKYEWITKKSDFSGTIEKISNYKSNFYLTLDDSTKILVVSGTANFNYEKHHFYKIAKKGDVIKKSAENDTIYLIGEDKKYKFINNVYIEKNK